MHPARPDKRNNKDNIPYIHGAKDFPTMCSWDPEENHTGLHAAPRSWQFPNKETPLPFGDTLSLGKKKYNVVFYYSFCRMSVNETYHVDIQEKCNTEDPVADTRIRAVKRETTRGQSGN